MGLEIVWVNSDRHTGILAAKTGLYYSIYAKLFYCIQSIFFVYQINTIILQIPVDHIGDPSGD